MYLVQVKTQTGDGGTRRLGGRELRRGQYK